MNTEIEIQQIWPYVQTNKQKQERKKKNARMITKGIELIQSSSL